MKTKSIGQKAWEVEWCSEVPLIPGTKDADMDQAKYHVALFPNVGLARSFAKRILPKDWFGSVRLTPMEAVDEYDIGRATGWEPCGETEHIEIYESK